MTDIATVFLLFITAGAVLGFILAIVGMPPLFDFPNPDGRPNYFYYVTLSNSVLGNVIRPSGIYEEPGSLSFYICAISIIRHLLNKDKKLTWVLIILGFVTLSLAHLLYVVFHFLSERFTKKNLVSVLPIFFLAITVAYISGFIGIIEDRLIQRLVFSDTSGSIAGDNRSFRMFNVIDLINREPKIISFGADPTCRFDYFKCKSLFPPTGENPLTPLFNNGLLVSWPYYLSLVFFFFSPFFGRKYLVVLGFGLLLVQRPSVLTISGGMVTGIIIFILITNLKKTLAQQKEGGMSIAFLLQRQYKITQIAKARM